MNLNDITSVPCGRRRKFRVGRGRGSGQGKTSRRGYKGASSRAGWGGGIMREGGQMPIVRRLPKKGFNNKNFRVNYEVVNVSRLVELGIEGEITPDTLKAVGLVKKSARWVKILGKGEITSAVKVAAHHISAGARSKIEAVGGSVRILPGHRGVVVVPRTPRDAARKKKIPQVRTRAVAKDPKEKDKE
jgi:large subunit ribosomal protein L15